MPAPAGQAVTQREAAEEAARKIGLNRLTAPEDSLFEGYSGRRKMFWKRYAVLEQAAQQKSI